MTAWESQAYFSGPSFPVLAEISLDRGHPPLKTYPAWDHKYFLCYREGCSETPSKQDFVSAIGNTVKIGAPAIEEEDRM